MNADLRVADPRLEPIREKVLAGQWLDEADGVVLYDTRDIHGVGRLANWANEQLHGDVVYYNRNRHINYTNVCALSCKFCSFYRKKGESGAYEASVDQIVAAAVAAAERGATEVHIVGGLHPWLKFDYYLDALRGVRAAAPQLHIKAFTAIEIVHLSRIARLSVRETLVELKKAGLGSLPGGGAEIFDDRVHDEAFKGKVREDKWFDVHRNAHQLGLFTNATMLYGHIEQPVERVRHLIKLRDLQAESLAAHNAAYFNCIIPLSFIPHDSELGALPGPTGLTDLKTLAIARLMTPNIANIKAFWIMQTVHLSQLALHWGCNDLDGTVVWYDITKEKTGDVHQELHVADIKRLIREVGRRPVERDTVYREVHRDPVTDAVVDANAMIA